MVIGSKVADFAILCPKCKYFHSTNGLALEGKNIANIQWPIGRIYITLEELAFALEIIIESKVADIEILRIE